MLLEEKLRRQTHLSPGEKNVADHILSLGRELKRYSTRNLADLTYTYPPTVIYLCKKMGCSGFDQLKDTLSIPRFDMLQKAVNSDQIPRHHLRLFCRHHFKPGGGI